MAMMTFYTEKCCPATWKMKTIRLLRAYAAAYASSWSSTLVLA